MGRYGGGFVGTDDIAVLTNKTISRLDNTLLDLGISNADIDAAAAIEKTKLAALAILDADVAISAEIAKYKLDIPTVKPNPPIWTIRTSAGSGTVNGYKVIWSSKLGIFCAVGDNGSWPTISISSDGITWTSHSGGAQNGSLGHVAWSPALNLFCAVGYGGSGGNTRVWTSPTGITWTPQTISNTNYWHGICWSPDLNLFCMVSDSQLGTIANRVMTSPDGINWTPQTASVNADFACIGYAAGQFVAAGKNDLGGANASIMTSPDGINWTNQVDPDSTSINHWQAIAYSPELSLWVLVGYNNMGGHYQILTSPDAITWTPQSHSLTNPTFNDVVWSSDLGMFCAVAAGGKMVTSRDGITWTTVANLPTQANQDWYGICWAQELQMFCVSGIDTYKIMTSSNVAPTADVSGSRVKNTVYTNDSAGSCLLMVTADCLITTGGGTATMQVFADNSATPAVAVSGIVGIPIGLNAEDVSAQIVAIIDPGLNFQIVTVETNGTVTIGSWFEKVM